MAKSRKTTTKSVASKAPKVAAVEVEVVEESAGPGWESGAAIVTTILLVAAILLVDFELGRAFGAGVFFK